MEALIPSKKTKIWLLETCLLLVSCTARHKHTAVHRIIEQLRLERMLEVSFLCNMPLKPGLSVSPDRLAQGIIQSGIKNLQGQRPYNLYGLPVPLYDCPCGAKDFVYIQSEPLVSTYASCLSLVLCHVPLRWVWLRFPEDLLVNTGKLLLGPPQSFPFAG